MQLAVCILKLLVLCIFIIPHILTVKHSLTVLRIFISVYRRSRSYNTEYMEDKF